MLCNKTADKGSCLIMLHSLPSVCVCLPGLQLTPWTSCSCTPKSCKNLTKRQIKYHTITALASNILK